MVDLDAPGILPMQLRRNEDCLSGHKRFNPIHLDRTTADTTVKELFGLALTALEGDRATDSRKADQVQEISLAFRGHPILLSVACSGCGLELVRGRPIRAHHWHAAGGSVYQQSDGANGDHARRRGLRWR